MNSLYQRRVADVNQPQPLHHDAIRIGRAVMMPGYWEKHDPFLSMMNDKFKPGAFGPHPHRGFETVTYVIEGDLAHEDSKGGSGVLHQGDVQWMTAGVGVMHNESPVHDSGVHVLQLWLNLPAEHKLAPFRYQDLRSDAMPKVEQNGVSVKVFAGQFGETTGAAQTFSPVTLLEVTMAAGSEFRHQFDADENAFIYMLNGNARVGADETQAVADDNLWLEQVPNAASEIVVKADSDAKFLLLAGQPLREPVAAYGPFVMNTKAQLHEAVMAYQKGEFGEIR